MKKVLITVLVIAGILAAGFCYYQLTTPRYALVKTIADVKRSGAEGLRPHLTGDAAKIFDAVEAISENQWISGIVSSLSDTESAQMLKSKMADFDWSVEDILNGKESAEVVLRFENDDGISGTVTITMVRADKTWMIDGIRMPHFDSLTGN